MSEVSSSFSGGAANPAPPAPAQYATLDEIFYDSSVQTGGTLWFTARMDQDAEIEAFVDYQFSTDPFPSLGIARPPRLRLSGKMQKTTREQIEIPVVSKYSRSDGSIVEQWGDGAVLPPTERDRSFAAFDTYRVRIVLSGILGEQGFDFVVLKFKRIDGQITPAILHKDWFDQLWSMS